MFTQTITQSIHKSKIGMSNSFLFEVGARVLTGLMQKWRKIKGFRHSIIDNNLIYMHHRIYLILKKHSKKEKNLIKIGTVNVNVKMYKSFNIKMYNSFNVKCRVR